MMKREVAPSIGEGLSAAERARGRRLAITSHPAGNTFAMALSQHLPTITLVALGASESMIGAQSAFATGATLLQLPTLRRVARIPKRRILIEGQLIAIVGMVPLLFFPLLAEAAAAGDPRPAWIALAALAVAAAGINVSNTVWFPMLHAYMEPARIGRFFAFLRSGWHLTLIVFYLGAQRWLAHAPGELGPLFGVIFVLGLLRVALVARMPEQSEIGGEAIRIRESLASILRSPRMRRYLLGVTTGHALRAALLPFTLVMLQREIGLRESKIVLTMIATFAGGLVSLYAWGRLIDRRGAALVFRISSIGMALLTLGLLGVQENDEVTLIGVVVFFFLFSVLAAGFGIADTHVLFRLTPAAAPARTLVIAAVAVGLIAAMAPLLTGLVLEHALAATSDRLLVYHLFFILSAILQAVHWWPLRVFGPDRA